MRIGRPERSIDTMRKQIHLSIPKDEAERLSALLNGRSVYAYALEALREKMQRDERENR